MKIPGLSRDSRLCACRTVHLDHPDENRKDGSITHNLYCCRDEIRPEDVEAPARVFFIARDADSNPTLWVEENGRPVAMARKSELHPEVWLLLASHPDTQAAGNWCDTCGEFVIDVEMDEAATHRAGRCA